ncbi:MAG: hypothetical protein PHG08_07260 [Bacilli bacterium]|jgi:hypothetical protein|nr:hypothetical protein [Bacilli bacterium]HHU23921.1 hypothetical protein [Acholeplasmataceae bacterium]
MKFLKYSLLIISVLFLLITTTVSAFLTSSNTISDEQIIGEVVVDVEAYYQRGQERLDIDLESAEDGVIELNISDPSQLTHFNNLRVNIKIYSSVLTYFRVQVVEQFTLTYITGNQKTVVAIAKEGFAKFNYQEDFQDNRIQDGYFYYMEKVKRVAENEPTVIEFIGQLPAEDYHPIYENKYTLRIGFVIDAVQYLNGPQMNWGLANPPWGGEW